MNQHHDRILFCADLHFGHKLMLERRGMLTTDDHDHVLFDRLIEYIPTNSTVYVLGDASFRPAKRTVEIFKELRQETRSDFILIKGNHDRGLTRQREAQAWTDVHDYLEVIVPDACCPHGRQLICVMHYALETWRNRHWGSWMLHGHWHGTGSTMPGRLDVGVDALSFNTPIISYAQLKTRLPQRYGTPIERPASLIED